MKILLVAFTCLGLLAAAGCHHQKAAPVVVKG
jgi:hypothetical protein